MKISKALLIFVLAISAINTHAQNCDNLNGEWVNELGSVLQIDSIAENGNIYWRL